MSLTNQRGLKMIKALAIGTVVGLGLLLLSIFSIVLGDVLDRTILTVPPTGYGIGGFIVGTCIAIGVVVGISFWESNK